MSALLEVRDLTKRFPARRDVLGRVREWHPAVTDVSFELHEGETLALVGESGAGKSTTGNLVLRLLDPDSGTIRLNGVDLTALSPKDLRRQRRSAQMIFQDPYGSLDPRVAIGDSISEPLLIHDRASKDVRMRRAAELLDRVGLSSSDIHRYPDEFSGGQLQRIAIARALILEPTLIVCDEPVAALDVSIQAQVLNLMFELQRERGLSYLFITHDLNLVRVIAHRVAIMRHGQIVETGAVRSIFENPQATYTRELIAATPQPVPPGLRQTGAGGARRLTSTDPSPEQELTKNP